MPGMESIKAGQRMRGVTMSNDPDRRKTGVEPGKGRQGDDLGSSFGNASQSSSKSSATSRKVPKISRKESMKSEPDMDSDDSDEMNIGYGSSQSVRDEGRAVRGRSLSRVVSKVSAKEKGKGKVDLDHDSDIAPNGHRYHPDYKPKGKLPSFKKTKTEAENQSTVAFAAPPSSSLLAKLSSLDDRGRVPSSPPRRPLKSKSPNHSQSTAWEDDVETPRPRPPRKKKAFPLNGISPPPTSIARKRKDFPMNGTSPPSRSTTQKKKDFPLNGTSPPPPPPPKPKNPILQIPGSPTAGPSRAKSKPLTTNNTPASQKKNSPIADMEPLDQDIADPPPLSGKKSTFPDIPPLFSTVDPEPSAPSNAGPKKKKPPRARKKNRVDTTSDEESEVKPMLKPRKLRPFPMAPSPPKRLSDGQSGGPMKKRRSSGGFTAEDAALLQEPDMDDISRDLDDSALIEIEDPDTLCPFCDERLPDSPSPIYTRLLASITRKSYPDPRPHNPKGLKAPFHVFLPLCQRHQFEEHQLPLARQKGWPTDINFQRLPSRIEGGAVLARLKAVVRAKEVSVFWREVKAEIAKKGSRAVVGVRGQFDSFDKTQPGYYGEMGAVIIVQTLFNLFPLTDFDTAEVAPLTPSEFIQRVLVPETAVALIKEDMHCTTEEEAISTLRESVQFGVAMYPDLDREDGVGAAIVKKRAKARRKEIEEEEGAEDDFMETDGSVLGRKEKEKEKEKKGKGKERVVESTANAQGKKKANAVSESESDRPTPTPPNPQPTPTAVPKTPRPKPRFMAQSLAGYTSESSVQRMDVSEAESVASSKSVASKKDTTTTITTAAAKGTVGKPKFRPAPVLRVDDDGYDVGNDRTPIAATALKKKVVAPLQQPQRAGSSTLGRLLTPLEEARRRVQERGADKKKKASKDGWRRTMSNVDTEASSTEDEPIAKVKATAASSRSAKPLPVGRQASVDQLQKIKEEHDWLLEDDDDDDNDG